MSDLSPLWVGARCEGTMDASKCNGHGSCVNCVGRELFVWSCATNMFLNDA